jgi:hypothetical protein
VVKITTKGAKKMELIKMEVQEITENKIDIRNEHTIFSSRIRIDYPNINKLEKEVKELRKELKDLGVSLGKTNTLKLLRYSKEDYNEMVKDYNSTFNELLVAWSNKMHVGIYVGYGSDEYYTDYIRPMEFKLTKMNNTTTILSKISHIQYRVNEIKQELKHGKEYSKIWL